MSKSTQRSRVRFGDREIGDGLPALVVGEVAQTHEGSLGLAHAFVDAIAEAGADAIKFQTHIAAAESTPAEPFRVAFSKQDSTRFDYWRRMEFTEDEWSELEEHSRARELLFLSSPFSVEAVELLERVGVPGWKIGSGEISNLPLLERAAETGLPLILSSGLSDFDELDSVVEWLRQAGAKIVVLQAASRYPCLPEQVGLNVLPELRTRYGCPVGISDHSGTIYPAIAAATLGASVIEVHVTLSKEMFGPDVPASVTTGELRQMVEGVRFIESALSSPVDKRAAAEELRPLRAMFSRSIVARTELDAGTVLREELLAVKKPGGGLAPERIPELVGRRLRRDVQADQLLAEDDIE